MGKHDVQFKSETPDYAVLPPLRPTERQLAYAQQISASSGVPLPGIVQADRRRLSRWIDANAAALRRNAVKPSNHPSSRQVAFAERIARGRQRDIPDECYRSAALLGRWIDSNKW